MQVCAFNLVDQVQEFLREHNKNPDDSVDRPQQSLWHQWQQRIKADSTAPASSSGADNSQLGGVEGGVTMHFDWTTQGEGLFADDDDVMFGPILAHPRPAPVVAPRAPVSPGPEAEGGKGAPAAQLLHEPGTLPEGPIPSATSDLVPTSSSEELAVAPAALPRGPSPRIHRSSGSDASFSRGTSPAGGSSGDDSPPLLSRLARSGAVFRAPSSDDSDSEGSSDDGSEPELGAKAGAAGSLKSQLMVGHLLLLATSGGERKTLADCLKRTDVLPSWLHRLVTGEGGPERLTKAIQALYVKVEGVGVGGLVPGKIFTCFTHLIPFECPHTNFPTLVLSYYFQTRAGDSGIPIICPEAASVRLLEPPRQHTRPAPAAAPGHHSIRRCGRVALPD